MRLTSGPSPAKPDAMFSEVLARWGPSRRCASGSSADDSFAENASALESDAPQPEGPRRAKTSENIAFGFAGEGPKVNLTALWPPPFRTGPAKRYVQSVFELLERAQPPKPREIQRFARQVMPNLSSGIIFPSGSAQDQKIIKIISIIPIITIISGIIGIIFFYF